MVVVIVIVCGGGCMLYVVVEAVHGGDGHRCVAVHGGITMGTTVMQILPLCYLHLVAASRSYTCAQDGVDTVQLALVVFFLPPTSENTPLAFMVVITRCNLRWWCFSLEH